MSRREAIKDLEEHCEQLKETNLQVARSIVDTDRNSLSRDKDLLNQQEQMRVRNKYESMKVVKSMIYIFSI